MSNNNTFIIQGNLGQDIQEFEKNGRKFAVLNVATDNEMSTHPDWHRVELPRGYHSLKDKLTMGSLVRVKGHLTSTRRTDIIIDPVTKRKRKRTFHSQILIGRHIEILKRK